MAGRAASTKPFTCTSERGLYIISDQIVSSSSSLEHEQLLGWGHNSKQRAWITWPSTLTYPCTLCWHPASANLGGLMQMVIVPARGGDESGLEFCFVFNHISFSCYLLNSVLSSFISYSRKSVLKDIVNCQTEWSCALYLNTCSAT